MANDGKVVIELVGKDSATQTFVKSMKDMASSAQQLEASGKGLGAMGGMLNSLKGHWVALAASIAGGISIGKFLSDFDKLATTESAMLKMAKRLNDTVENISALGYVAKKSGMDADAFNIAMERMQKNVSNAAKGVAQATGMVDEFGEPVGKAGKALDELGMRAEVLNKLSVPQKLKAIASAMQDNVAPADQARVTMELFGKSGGGLVLPLKQGSGAIQEMLERYEKLGGVLTTEGAEAMSKAKTATGDLKIAMDNFGRTLWEDVAPHLTTVFNLLTDLTIAAKNFKFPVMLPLAPGSGAGTLFKDAAGQGGGGGGSGWGHMPGDPWITPDNLRKTPTKLPPEKPTAPKGGGGGGLESAQRQLENFIKTMEEQTAKASGDGIAALDVWFAKESQTLDLLTAKTGESEAARAALGAAYAGKRTKIEEDFNLFVAKESGNAYVEIEAQARAWLVKYQGIAGAEGQIAAIERHKTWLEDVKQYEARAGLEREMLDTLASTSPFLVEQLGYKERSLALEIDLGHYTLEKKLLEMDISEEQKNQYRSLQAVTDQARKYNLERSKWPTQGFAGGVKMGIEGLKQTADTWGATQVSDFIKNAPRDISTSMASMFVDTLRGRKTDFESLGWSMGEKMIQMVIEGWIYQVLPLIKDSLSGLGGGGGGGIGGFFSSLFGGGGGGIDYDVMYSGGALAHGGILSRGVLQTFASGGIVTRPTLFAMANGMGLMGEDGPEAVMPLTRLSGGDLGVKAAGGGSGPPQVHLTIINNTPNSEAKVESGPAGDIIVTIDQLVSKAYSRRGSLFQLINAGSGTVRR